MPLPFVAVRGALGMLRLARMASRMTRGPSARGVLRGAAEMQRTLQRIAANVPEQAEDALEEAAEDILQEAQARVPIDTGELHDSGGVQVTNDRHRTRVEIFFTAPHAPYVHEDLEADHPTGEAKFLESAMNEAESDLLNKVGKSINLKEAL